MKFGYFCNTTNWTHKPYYQLLDETKEITEYCDKNNYQENEFVYYGLFNNRYEYKFTRILVLLEKILFFRSRFKKFVYIKCKFKKNQLRQLYPYLDFYVI